MLLKTKIISAVAATVVGTSTLIGGIAYFNEKPLNTAMASNEEATQTAITQMGKANIIIGQLNRKVNSNKETIDNLNKQLTTTNAQIQKLQQELKAKDEQVNKANTQVQKLQQELKDKDGQVTQANDKATSYKSAFETEVGEVNKANSYVQEKATKLNSESEMLKNAALRLGVSTSDQNVLANANLK